VVVVIYKVPGLAARVRAYAGLWTGVLVCHGVVEQAKSEGKPDEPNHKAGRKTDEQPKVSEQQTKTKDPVNQNQSPNTSQKTDSEP
jgi:hypothetical protein